MSYSVGNLHLALTGIDKSATKSIDNVITKLNQLNSALSVFGKSNLAGFSNLSAQLSAFSKATGELNFKNFNSFVNRLNKMDFAKVGSGFAELEKAITPFLEKITLAEKGLTSLYGVMQKASGKKFAAALGTSGGSGGNKFGLGGLFNLGKIASTVFLARRLATVVGGIVQKGSEYTETLNLWQVSMRDNLDLAEQFITKMNKAYGISEKTLMNAQAVFKNMIGSLGQVSDQTAYMLSETLIQMSVDFASLYNTTLQQAFSKIQAMLAGQVRPIRSAGLDMTETTLFMYYQQMGGTKTMRQLNRTEKQLLSIYAVFEQMGKAGALGDMTKTLNTFANQTRITAEAWEELMTWTGVVVKHLIQESGILTTVNALLLTMGEIMQAVANSMGATDENFADALFESVDATNGALDEMQGKLLDFDKFRSLQGQGENFLGIDEKLLQAITGYSSVIEKANNAARQQAEIWLQNLGFVDENNDGVYEMTENAWKLFEAVKAVGSAIAIAFTIPTIIKFVGALKIGVAAVQSGITVVRDGLALLSLAKEAGKTLSVLAKESGGVTSATMGFANAIKFLTNPLFLVIAGLAVLYATSEDFREGVNSIFKALKPLISALLGMITQIIEPLGEGLSSILDFIGIILGFVAKIVSVIVSFGVLIVNCILVPVEAVVKAVATVITLIETLFSWDWGNLGKKLSNLWGNWSSANAIIDTLNSIKGVNLFADGGIPDKGTMFLAGEAGAEVVYNTPSGQSGVVNVKQIQQAMYGALVAYGKTHGGVSGNQPIEVSIDGEKVFRVVDKQATRHGVGFVKK